MSGTLRRAATSEATTAITSIAAAAATVSTSEAAAIAGPTSAPRVYHVRWSRTVIEIISTRASIVSLIPTTATGASLLRLSECIRSRRQSHRIIQGIPRCALKCAQIHFDYSLLFLLLTHIAIGLFYVHKN